MFEIRKQHSWFTKQSVIGTKEGQSLAKPIGSHALRRKYTHQIKGLHHQIKGIHHQIKEVPKVWQKGPSLREFWDRMNRVLIMQS